MKSMTGKYNKENVALADSACCMQEFNILLITSLGHCSWTIDQYDFHLYTTQ